MGSSWIVYLLVTLITGNPLVGLLVAVAVLWGAEGWFRGRFWSPAAPFRRWQRIRALRDHLAASPHDATAAAQLGGMLVDRRPAEARSLLQAVHDRYPDMALVAFHLGAARLNLGDTAGGEAAIAHALALKADLGYGEPMVRMGDHFHAHGRSADAVGWYRKAAAVHRSSAEVRYKLGRALRATGDRPGARAAFREALEVTRGSPAFKRRLDRSWRVRAWLAATFG